MFSQTLQNFRKVIHARNFIMSSKNNEFAVTICGYRKPDLDEDEYHRYISEKHAGHLKDLLVRNKIVRYTMHNTSQTRKVTEQVFGQNFANMADCDAFVQIVFRDVQDYISVREDSHFKEVVNPDHANFSDPTRTRMVIGWLEDHVIDSKIV